MATTAEHSANPGHPENPYIEPIPGRKTDVKDGGLGDPKPWVKDGLAGPAPPPPLLGPYFGFCTTIGHRWLGSCLLLYKIAHKEPELSFDVECKTTRDVLYKDVFGMTAIRINLEFEIPDGLGDEKIGWTLKAQPEERHGYFHIARWEQKIRMAAHSCNGFDETVPESSAKDLGFDNVWLHLNSIHEETPLHYMIWGGDQIYIDYIFDDVPFCKRWLKMDWDLRWTHEFSEDASRVCAEYYFRTYAENWERKEVKYALSAVPALMQWDDHDIFDGAGSYPSEQRDSPVMKGLMQTAQKFRLLFQMHTTPMQCRKHGLFGVQGQNFVAQLGPRIAALGTDGRTERDANQVQDPKTFDMIFEKLYDLPESTQHLIVIFPVPFSFIRVRIAEKAFDFIKNHPKLRDMPFIRSGNSIFGLPEFLDDLLDEWCHDKHINQRNHILAKFQDFAEKRSIRVTFVSGDVHCAAMSRFRSDKATRKAQSLRPEQDARLMYQAISSAIVNVAPSPNACMAYHYIKTAWNPIRATEEGLLDFFERRPEHGKHVRHKKVMPNRNWLYLEEVGKVDAAKGISSVPTERYRSEDDAISEAQSQEHRFHLPGWHSEKEHAHVQWFENNYPFEKRKAYPSTLGPTSATDGKGCVGQPNHVHKHGLFCHHRASRVPKKTEPGSDLVKNPISLRGNESNAEESGLRIRLWLESRVKEAQGRQFSSYEVIVPKLVTATEVERRRSGTAADTASTSSRVAVCTNGTPNGVPVSTYASSHDGLPQASQSIAVGA